MAQQERQATRSGHLGAEGGRRAEALGAGHRGLRAMFADAVGWLLREDRPNAVIAALREGIAFRTQHGLVVRSVR